MRKALREIFSDKENRLSSKRILGTASFVFSVIVTVWVILDNKDYNVLMYPYTLTGGLLGLGVFEKK